MTHVLALLQVAEDIGAVEGVLARTVLDPATLEGMAFYGLVLLAAAVAVARVIARATRRTVERQPAALDTAALSFASRLAQILVYVVAFALFAHLIPELRSLGKGVLAGAGVASFVLGLAAQQTLGNLVAGISLLVYRPFRAGEWIEVTTPNGVESGFVEDLTLGYTLLHTLDKRRIVVPNSLFAKDVMVNQSMRDQEVTVNVTVPVVHTADTARACAVLREIAEGLSLVHEVVDSRVAEVTVDGTLLLLRVRCGGTLQGREITFDVLEAARARFADEGIELAYRYRNHEHKKHDTHPDEEPPEGDSPTSEPVSSPDAPSA